MDCGAAGMSSKLTSQVVMLLPEIRKLTLKNGGN